MKRYNFVVSNFLMGTTDLCGTNVKRNNLSRQNLLSGRLNGRRPLVVGFA
jgi:hypothetical protein